MYKKLYSLVFVPFIFVCSCAMVVTSGSTAVPTVITGSEKTEDQLFREKAAGSYAISCYVSSLPEDPELEYSTIGVVLTAGDTTDGAATVTQQKFTDASCTTLSYVSIMEMRFTSGPAPKEIDRDFGKDLPFDSTTIYAAKLNLELLSHTITPYTEAARAAIFAYYRVSATIGEPSSIPDLDTFYGYLHVKDDKSSITMSTLMPDHTDKNDRAEFQEPGNDHNYQTVFAI